MEFNKVPQVFDPVKASQVRALIESIQDLARRIPEQTEISITQVSAGQYNVKATDQYLVVNSKGGRVQIVLPLPAVKQVLTILKSDDSGNSITVARKDGKPIGNVHGTFTVDSTEALLADGSQWWSL